MNLRPTLASAPGKLLLAGEYAVLEPGEPALVVAIDRTLSARVLPATSFSFSSEALGIEEVPVSMTGDRWVPAAGPAMRVAYAEVAVTTALEYLRSEGFDIPPFSLSLEGSLESPDGKKYGFGSSAAVTVAVIGALLGAFDIRPSASEVFKLAAIAHHGAQGSGSGADVAASAYGGVVRYVSFDRDWLAREREHGTPLAKLIDVEWPLLGIEPLDWPEGLELGIGWTGQPASTVHLIRAVAAESSKRSPAYARFLITSRQAVNALSAAIKESRPESARDALALARTAILVLQEATGVSIETPLLHELAEAAAACGGSGKSSGAGGGDCGLALFPDEQARACASALWRDRGIEPVDAAIAPTGLIIHRV